MERFGGVEGLADEREGFSRKGVVVKMIENREDDLLCYMTKGAGKWVIHFSGFELLFGRWGRIEVGEHGELGK